MVLGQCSQAATGPLCALHAAWAALADADPLREWKAASFMLESQLW